MLLIELSSRISVLQVTTHYSIIGQCSVILPRRTAAPGRTHAGNAPKKSKFTPTWKKKLYFLQICGVCRLIFVLHKMEASTASLDIQNSVVARPSKKKSKGKQLHRPYKSISAANLESRIADITKKVQLYESKVQALREKLTQHQSEVSMRDTTSNEAA